MYKLAHLNIRPFILFSYFDRTDFYRLMKSKDDKLGFPPGVAAKILLSVSIVEFCNVQHFKDCHKLDAPRTNERGGYCFCPVSHSVTLSFCHCHCHTIKFLLFCNSVWNFYLANNFSTLSARALIFHMNIPCDKYQHFLPWDLDLGVWPTVNFWKQSWRLFINVFLPL